MCVICRAHRIYSNSISYVGNEVPRYLGSIRASSRPTHHSSAAIGIRDKLAKGFLFFGTRSIEHISHFGYVVTPVSVRIVSLVLL